MFFSLVNQTSEHFLCIYKPTCTVSSPLKVFDMYQGYAQHHGWSFDILEYMTSEIGQWIQTLVIIVRLKGQFTQTQSIANTLPTHFIFVLHCIGVAVS